MSRSAAIREVMAQHPGAAWTSSSLAAATGFERDLVTRALVGMEHQRMVERVGPGTYLLCRLPQRQASAETPARRGPCPQSDAVLRALRAGGNLTSRQLASRVCLRESTVTGLLAKLAVHELVREQGGMWGAV